MGLFKGNLGNLMQHWVLSEILVAARESGYADLFFLCTHSMAPFSQQEPRAKGTSKFHLYFDAARRRLFDQRSSGQTLTHYEKTWQSLSSPSGLPYPSSAAFAAKQWTGNLSLWLCEKDSKIAGEISDWWSRPDFGRPLLGNRIYEGAWQDCFKKPMSLLFERASACDLALLEFDPDMVISQAGTKQENPRIIYREDLDLIRSLASRLAIPVVIQLSSYSPNFDNTPQVVEQAVTKALSQDGFLLEGQVAVENSMTSLVYTKNVRLWNSQPQSLGNSFKDWLPSV